MIVPSKEAKQNMLKQAEVYAYSQTDFLKEKPDREFYKELIIPHFIRGYEWGYSDAAHEFINKSIKDAATINRLEAEIRRLKTELGQDVDDEEL